MKLEKLAIDFSLQKEAFIGPLMSAIRMGGSKIIGFGKNAFSRFGGSMFINGQNGNSDTWRKLKNYTYNNKGPLAIGAAGGMGAGILLGSRNSNNNGGIR